MLDTISIYIYIYWHEIYRTYMFTIYVCMVIDMKYNRCDNGSCSVHRTCNMRNCSDISIAYAQGDQHIGCVCMDMVIHHQY